MEPRKPRGTKRGGPEQKIQNDLIEYLKLRDWLIKVTHGNEFQSGLPDLYCAHKKYGQRWIEVKNPESYAFTAAQLDFFPKLAAVGVGVWVLVAATEPEYKKLWLPPNWHTYLSIMKR